MSRRGPGGKPPARRGAAARAACAGRRGKPRAPSRTPFGLRFGRPGGGAGRRGRERKTLPQGIWCVVCPWKVTEITPPQMHISFDVLLSAGM